MDSNQRQEEAVGVLQELGLKEYEAKSFVALSRTRQATAKEISNLTDVPRTRVYDSVRVLEAMGLVEVQHANPQLFRAVPVDEAVDSLEEQYESRVDTLREALSGLEPVEDTTETLQQEVWALSGSDAVATRTHRLLEEAADEIVLVVGSDHLLTADLLESLEEASTRVDVIVGALTKSAERRIQEAVPEATVFVSGLEWLHSGETHEKETAVGRLLLVDRETFLVSSIDPRSTKEQAIFGEGFGNGLIVIARRLMATGLIPAGTPDQS